MYSYVVLAVVHGSFHFGSVVVEATSAHKTFYARKQTCARRNIKMALSNEITLPRTVNVMKSEERLLSRIVVDPKIMVGKPIIRGTRIPVEQILRLLGQGLTNEQILKDYPHLTKDDILATLLYAAKVTSKEEVYPATAE